MEFAFHHGEPICRMPRVMSTRLSPSAMIGRRRGAIASNTSCDPDDGELRRAVW
jgi:hypothetical protein